MPILDIIKEKVAAAFEDLGLPRELAEVTVSDRPDLSDFQSNGAFKASKILRKNPREIAAQITEKLSHEPIFRDVSVAGPGFLNFTLHNDFLSGQLESAENVAPVKSAAPQKIVIDYGGPNVAKPLHVGHLRTAIIGEAIKRTGRLLGHEVIGDVHWGDWGTPMGMLLAALEEAHPDWPYFQEGASEFPSDSPISVDALNTLYPEASGRFKSDEDFADKARAATAKLQEGHVGYRALHKHFVSVSTADVRRDYAMVNVDFDLWLGESDTQDMLAGMVDDLMVRGVASESQGAIVIDVLKDDDKKEMPPVILRKKDGGATYGTTDLATIKVRREDLNADRIIYVVDQRQSLHFEQVFRAAEKAGFMDVDKLEHAGFGTMNGRDGKPFKTRDGGVMRLGQLIAMAGEEVRSEMGLAQDAALDSDIQKMVDTISVAAIKFGDLSVTRTSDYVFDIKEFVKTEGKTGPYIQYAAVRIQSILAKAAENGIALNDKADIILDDAAERALALKLLAFPEIVERSWRRLMPSDLCEHAFELAQAFSSFYAACPILATEEEPLRQSRLQLAALCRAQLETCFDLLAIDIPDKMLKFTEESAAA